jgi:hypothetical protein
MENYEKIDKHVDLDALKKLATENDIDLNGMIQESKNLVDNIYYRDSDKQVKALKGISSDFEAARWAFSVAGIISEKEFKLLSKVFGEELVYAWVFHWET